MGDWVGGSIFLHGPHLSDPFMGTTEARGFECLKRDNDSRPLFAGLKRRQAQFLSQFVFACLSCMGGLGRSVWITVVKRPQHTDQSSLSLGAAKCFGEQRCLWGAHGEGQAASELPEYCGLLLAFPQVWAVHRYHLVHTGVLSDMSLHAQRGRALPQGMCCACPYS